MINMKIKRLNLYEICINGHTINYLILESFKFLISLMMNKKLIITPFFKVYSVLNAFKNNYLSTPVLKDAN